MEGHFIHYMLNIVRQNSLWKLLLFVCPGFGCIYDVSCFSLPAPVMNRRVGVYELDQLRRPEPSDLDLWLRPGIIGLGRQSHLGITEQDPQCHQEITEHHQLHRTAVLQSHRSGPPA